MSDKETIYRQDAIDVLHVCLPRIPLKRLNEILSALPSAQPERYTKEELRVFAHGISLSLLSKRSAQHWQYDKDTATEIEFLERLYDKVSANMKGGQG